MLQVELGLGLVNPHASPSHTTGTVVVFGPTRHNTTQKFDGVASVSIKVVEFVEIYFVDDFGYVFLLTHFVCGFPGDRIGSCQEVIALR